MKFPAIPHPVLVYLESVAAGVVLAFLVAAYQALQAPQAPADWRPIVAAGLLGAFGYLQACLRWWLTQSPQVPQPPVLVTSSLASLAPPQPPAPPDPPRG